MLAKIMLTIIKMNEINTKILLQKYRHSKIQFFWVSKIKSYQLYYRRRHQKIPYQMFRIPQYKWNLYEGDFLIKKSIQDQHSFLFSACHFTESELPEELVERLGSQNERVSQLYLIDGKVDASLMKRFAKTRWILEHLIFQKCDIGNELSHVLQVIDTSHLKALEISSEKLSNKGLHQLLKLDMSELTQLSIQNTNITADSVKIFKKYSFVFLQIKFHQIFNMMTFFKQALSCLKSGIHQYQRPSAPRIMTDDIFRSERFIYLPHFAKIIIEQPFSSKEILQKCEFSDSSLDTRICILNLSCGEFRGDY